MRAHYLQHVPFEGLGSIRTWLRNAGYKTSSTKFYESADLPSPDEIDLLVIMGGSMSSNDEEEFPWLPLEKKFLREVIESDKPVLGVCLGAQLIASVMGGEISPNPVKEIGWFPIRPVPASSNIPFAFPETIKVLHWHSETFSLPPGAIRIAESSGCRNQAFQIGKTVIGLQFHLEITPESTRELVFNCRDELIPSCYVQCEEDILSESLESCGAANQLMNDVLAYLQG